MSMSFSIVLVPNFFFVLSYRTFTRNNIYEWVTYLDHLPKGLKVRTRKILKKFYDISNHHNCFLPLCRSFLILCALNDMLKISVGTCS